MARNLNFHHADTVESALATLGNVIDQFREDASELDAAWQSRSAGRPWYILADELEAAYNRAAKKIKKVYPLKVR